MSLKAGFQLEKYSVFPTRNTISGPDGDKRLEPKCMQVLQLLAERAGEVVTRGELLDRAWKDTYSGDEALSRSISLLRSALGGGEAGRKYIQTVPKTGYRLTMPVTELASVSNDNGTVEFSPPNGENSSSLASVVGALMRPVPLLASLAIILALGFAILQLGNVNQTAELPQPEQVAKIADAASVAENSIAVLPLTNKSPDPDKAYFANGIHESILNQLVKIRAMRVTSRSSVLRYANSEKSLKEIGQELGVETLFLGSVRFADDRIKINAELIRASDEVYLWTESYEFQLDDIFDIEAEVALQVARAMETSLLPEELADIERPTSQSVEAYTLFLQHRYQLERESARSTLAPDGWIEMGIAKLEKAVAIDPLFAMGWAELGFVSWLKGSISTPDEMEVLYDRALAYANRAVALDPGNSNAFETLARVAFDRAEWANWENNARKSVQMNDLDGRAAFNFAMTLANVGQYEEAYSWYDVAISKSPTLGYYHEGAIAARIWGGDYENAYRMTGQYLAVGGDVNAYHAFRAYTLYKLGRSAESNSELASISNEPMLVAMWVIPGFHDYLRCQSGEQKAVMEELNAMEISPARELRIQYCAAAVDDIDEIFESFYRTISDNLIIYLTDVITKEVRADERWQVVSDYMSLPEDTDEPAI